MNANDKREWLEKHGHLGLMFDDELENGPRAVVGEDGPCCVAWTDPVGCVWDGAGDSAEEAMDEVLKDIKRYLFDECNWESNEFPR